MNPPSHRPVRFYQHTETPLERPVSVLDWIVTLIVLGIPVLNLILYLYWALSDTTAPSKRNYCRACILMFLFLLFLGGIFAALIALCGAAVHYQAR